MDAPDKRGGHDPGSDVFEDHYLYDLQVDPYELTNLVGVEAHRPVVEKMRERLIHRMVEAGEVAPEIRSAEVTKRGQRRVSEEEALE